jgi:hypothetical protein
LSTEINGQDIKDFVTYCNYYTIPALDKYTAYFDAAVNKEIAGMHTFLVGLVAGFLVMFTLYQLVLYLPSVYKTNSEIKAERAMMLLVPHGVLTSFAPLQQLVNEMVEAEESRHSTKL